METLEIVLLYPRHHLAWVGYAMPRYQLYVLVLPALPATHRRETKQPIMSKPLVLTHLSVEKSFLPRLSLNI